MNVLSATSGISVRHRLLTKIRRRSRLITTRRCPVIPPRKFPRLLRTNRSRVTPEPCVKVRLVPAPCVKVVGLVGFIVVTTGGLVGFIVVTTGGLVGVVTLLIVVLGGCVTVRI